jgi:hypothetical protein
MFQKNELKCSSCNKEVTGNEKIVAFLDLPNSMKMPYGLLSAGIAKCATEVYCQSCYNLSLQENKF